MIDILYEYMFIYKRCRCSPKVETKESIGLPQLREHSKLLKLLSTPRRLQLLLLLDKGSHCVCDLMEHTGMSQTLVSHHLADLTQIGLLTSVRSGTYIDYRLTPKGRLIVHHLTDCLEEV